MFGPEWSIINAFLFIGLSLTTRDALHDMWQNRHLVLKMSILIVAGSALSWLIEKSSGRIAVASMAAFGISASIDGIAYHLARFKPKMIRMNLSNVFSALADSLIFPTIAFGGIMLSVTAGQFVAKVVGGFFWSAMLMKLSRRKGGHW
jgi:uncharacterized PurR-regulated membrane protein YhhQ (DUF165 family)